MDDVARAFLAATLNERVYGEVLNLSNPRTRITDQEVCKLVIDSAASGSGIEFVESPLTGPVIGSIEKAEQLLGWKPAKGRRDLEKTIARMVQRQAREDGG